jgi:hypothetical protein
MAYEAMFATTQFDLIFGGLQFRQPISVPSVLSVQTGPESVRGSVGEQASGDLPATVLIPSRNLPQSQVPYFVSDFL